MLQQEVIQRLADEIHRAGQNTTPIAPFTQAYPELTIEDAREIQLINIRRRMAAGAKMVGKKVGALASEGVSSAALGNPLRVVAWLANKLAEYGECLEAGDIVIMGSQNPAVYIDAGNHIEADFGPLGKICADFI